MASEVFQLAILLSLKDGASGGLDRFGAKLRGLGKDGAAAVQELDRIRGNLNRDLAIGGVGAAGLGLLYKGVEAAGDFQATMTDLRSTLATTAQNGKVDLNSLGADMVKAEAIAVKLGNALPGTTADFVEMMQVLKQNGLQTETIMNGAAEAVAHLAVANNAVPKEIAADFAQYGNLFKLKSEDFAPAADVFSRIYTSTGQTSQELVEAAKYFEGRAGASLGISGLKDAEQITRLFGLMGKSGLRGSIAGTTLTDFFSEYTKHGDKVQELQKNTGIKLDFFDKKGNFAGIDQVFAQMKQFDKLSQKDRGDWLEKIFGLRGISAANIFLAQGAEGWKNFNAEQDTAVGLEDKVAMKSATFNNQMEALGGTLTNLKVTVFEPMLPTLTSAAEKANDFVSTIQEFAKANPNLSKTTVEIIAMASSAMVLLSAYNSLTAGVKLFKLASAVSKSENLIKWLNESKVAADAAGDSFVVAAVKRKGLLGGIQNPVVKIGVQIGAIMGIEYLIGVIQREIQKAFDAGEAKRQAIETTNKNYSTFQQAEKDGTQFTKKDFAGQAATTWLSVMKGGLAATMASERAKLPFFSFTGPSKVSQDATERELYPITKWAGAANPFQTGFGGGWDNRSKAQGFQKTAPELADPRIMTEFLRQLRTRVPNQEEQKSTQYALQQAFPQSFMQATAQLQQEQQALAQSIGTVNEAFPQLSLQLQASGDLYNQQGQTVQLFGQNLSNLQQPIAQTQNDITNLANSAQRVPPPLNSIVFSANNAANSLNSLSDKIAGWQPPPSLPPQPTYLPNSYSPTGAGRSPSPTPIKTNFANSRSNGNPRLQPQYVSQNPSVFPPVRKAIGENIKIADARRILASSNSQTATINYSPKITVNGASPEAKQDFQAMLNEHANHISRLVADNMETRRLRA